MKLPLPRRRSSQRRTSHPRHRRLPGKASPPHRAIRLPAVSLLVTALTTAILGIADGAAYAADPPPVKVESVDQVVNNIRLWLMGIIASWATFCLTVGFLRYTSGDPAEVEKGKVAFRSAAIGYLGALLAPLLVTIIAKWVA
jgi:hypothetical protein